VNLRSTRRRSFIGRLPFPGGGLLAVGVWILVLAFPGGAWAQSSLAEAREVYETALATYQEVLDLRDQVLEEHEILMDRLQDARDSGDSDRLQEAMYRVWERGVELSGLDRQLQAAAAHLEQAGQAYLRSLDEREEVLLDALAETVVPAVRSRLEGEIAELRSRYREVERRVGTELVPTIRPLPELTIRPTDGPPQLRIKATILEDRALEYEAVLAALDEQITERERRMQQERGREDLLAGISRFDDDLLTGGGLAGSLPEEGEPLDGPPQRLILADLPLPQQVAELRELRSRVDGLREEAVTRARVFRQRAEGGPR
jgi:hypothetical protein